MSVNGGNGELSRAARAERSLARRPIDVLPYRVGASIDVLLVRDADRDAWGPPSAAQQKGLTRFASAALEVRRRFGVSGKVYKQPLRREGTGEPSEVLPLLVESDAPTASGHTSAEARWISLGEASEMVSPEFRPLMAALAARIGAGPRRSGPSTTTSARRRR